MENPFAGLLTPAHLDPYGGMGPRFLGVVDTCALLSSIRNDVEHGPQWRSRLLRMTGDGIALLYASDHVYTEVYRRLPKIAQNSSASVDALRQHFERAYLPALRFVSVQGGDSDDPQVMAITDPDDVPTGQLAKLIAPCVVFSEDRHLRKPGLAPNRWREVARAGVNLNEAVSKRDTAGRVVALPLMGMAGLVKVTARRIEVSPWLLSASLLAATAFFLRRPSRKQRAGEYMTTFFGALAAEYEQATQLEQISLRDLRLVRLSPPAAPSVRQQVAIVLARQQGPLQAREIHELVQQHFQDHLIPGLGKVRAALVEGPEFVQSGRNRWSFGRQAPPWQGVL
ncbi:hypothetical protein ABT352_22835 [Streptosporangium sp. NPDC000563]|uniref:hypothetical protein n=1 Tax=Streptosporangium sp. NPDC000563 TaxID=3154366 RepID=UPI0033203C8A